MDVFPILWPFSKGAQFPIAIIAWRDQLKSTLHLTWRHLWTKSVSYRGPEWNGPGKLECQGWSASPDCIHPMGSLAKKNILHVFIIYMYMYTCLYPCYIMYYMYIVHVHYIICLSTCLFFASKFDAACISASLILAIRIDLQKKSVPPTFKRPPHLSQTPAGNEDEKTNSWDFPTFWSKHGPWVKGLNFMAIHKGLEMVKTKLGLDGTKTSRSKHI